MRYERMKTGGVTSGGSLVSEDESKIILNDRLRTESHSKTHPQDMRRSYETLRDATSLESAVFSLKEPKFNKRIILNVMKMKLIMYFNDKSI